MMEVAGTTMASQYDVVVVGGSVTGACCTIALAREGHRILVLDQAVFPRDKPCGEGIMPQGVQVLSELGVLAEILAHGATIIRGMRYHNRQGVVAEANFPPSEGHPSHGVVMRRLQLDHLLLQRAKAFANVTVREGFKVTDVVQDGGIVRAVAGHPVGAPSERLVFHAPLIIGADGRHSVFHRPCGFTKTVLPRRRYGVTGHLSNVAGTGPYVEVLPHPHGEIYLAPCGEVSLVALLLEERAMSAFKGNLNIAYMDSLRSSDIRDRIAESELVPPVFAVGPLGFTIEPCYRPGLLLIGDSAGFLDPITGEGMTLALKSVRAAVPLIKEALAGGCFGLELGRRYERNRFELTQDIVRFTRLLLALSRHRSLADRAVRRISYDHGLFQKLLGIATGAQRYRDLSLSEKLSLLVG